MDAIRKQASKLREQVAKQQKAALKQFGGGLGDSENILTNETELQRHQNLENLYISTRTAKRFQREFVRGVDGYIVTGTKLVQIGTKLSEDSRKYGTENTCTSGSVLSKVALSFSRARVQIEKECNNLLTALGTQVAEPLRAMVVGSQLEDARQLAQRYDRVRQEAEAQVVEVSRRQVLLREPNLNSDNMLKLEAAETKLDELKSNMTTLGKEAGAAMAAVEGQQQRLTLQRLVSMVAAERTYHQHVLQILDELREEMLSDRQSFEASPISAADDTIPPTSLNKLENLFASQTYNGFIDGMGYFLGEVMHSYEAESDVELTLAIGDYVVVRKRANDIPSYLYALKMNLGHGVRDPTALYEDALAFANVTNNGWAEGECKGKAGWFPFGYVERRERVLASEVAEAF